MGNLKTDNVGIHYSCTYVGCDNVYSLPPGTYASSEIKDKLRAAGWSWMLETQFEHIARWSNTLKCPVHPVSVFTRYTKAWHTSPSEEVRTTSSTGGEKGVKPERMSLIPVEALEIMGRLYGFGAQKYAAHNWRRGYEWSKSYDALQRHASAFWRGEDIDEETGLPHLAGVVFHAFTLMIFMEEQPDFDDRYKPTKLEEENPF